MSTERGRFYNFGAFLLDATTCLLLHDGKPVPLSPKAIEILRVLITHHGYLVGKKELMDQVWPNIFVDEGNIAHYISELRQVMKDVSKGDRWIQTVPWRGYRFVGPVKEVDDAGPGLVPDRVGELSGLPYDGEQIEEGEGRALRYGRWIMVLLVVALLLVAQKLLRPPQPTVREAFQLTRDGYEKSGPLVTDGPLIYFSECGKGGGTECTAVSVPESGGERVAVPSLSGFSISDISPDGLQFLATKRVAPEEAPQLWTVPVRGGAPRSLGGLRGEEPSWSPDATQIVYWNKKSLFVARSDGSDPHLLATMPGIAHQPRWSPDGKVLRFQLSNPPNEGSALWEVWADGTHAHPLLPSRGNPPRECCGRWTADGRYFLFQQYGNNLLELWARQEKCAPFFWECGKLFPLAQAATSYEQPMPTRQGKSVFAIGGAHQTELSRYDLATRSFVPYLPPGRNPGNTGRFLEGRPVDSIREVARPFTLAQQSGWERQATTHVSARCCRTATLVT